MQTSSGLKHTHTDRHRQQLIPEGQNSCQVEMIQKTGYVYVLYASQLRGSLMHYVINHAFIHCGLMKPYNNIELGQHWLR